jgi:hypothetical protein
MAPERQDFAHRRVKFTSTGVEIGGHVRPPPWSTKDMNNADFDTHFMTPRPRPARERRSLPNPPNTLKTPASASPGPANRLRPPISDPARRPQPRRDRPKPPGSTGDSPAGKSPVTAGLSATGGRCDRRRRESIRAAAKRGRARSGLGRGFRAVKTRGNRALCHPSPGSPATPGILPHSRRAAPLAAWVLAQPSSCASTSDASSIERFDDGVVPCLGCDRVLRRLRSAPRRIRSAACCCRRGTRVDEQGQQASAHQRSSDGERQASFACVRRIATISR